MERVPAVAALRALSVVVFAVTWARSALAQSACGTSERPWVSLTFAGGAWPKGFETQVLGDLRAGFTDRGIDACADASGPSSEPPLATVRVASADQTSVAVSVEVRDAVTEKRVSRDVDLTRVPADGRAFAIALAVDELVWASWAEIALAKSQRAAAHATKPPPREVIAGVERELPHAPAGAVPEIALRFATEHYGGGQTHLGADLGALVPLGGRFTLDLDAGFRQGLRVSAPHGRILSSALGFGAGVRFAVVHTPAADAGVSVGARLAATRFRGAAATGATDAELAGLTAFARLGLFTSVKLAGPLHLDATAGAGAPLRALEATDDGRTITGVSGVELFGALGLAVEL